MSRLTQPFGALGCLAGFIAAIVAALIAFGLIRGWAVPGPAPSSAPTSVAAPSTSGFVTGPPATASPTSSSSPTATPIAAAPLANAACPLAAAALQRRIDDPPANEKESVERNIELYRAISEITSGQVSDDFVTIADLQGEYLDLIAPFGYDFMKYLASGDTAAFAKLVADQREPQQRAGTFLLQTCGIEFFPKPPE